MWSPAWARGGAWLSEGVAAACNAQRGQSPRGSPGGNSPPHSAQRAISDELIPIQQISLPGAGETKAKSCPKSSSPREDGHQVLQLLVDFVWIHHRLGDFVAQQLRIAVAETEHGVFHRLFRHPQCRTDLHVAAFA